MLTVPAMDAAGCIPVFVGPPYNSMPFPGSIDYAAAGVFFNVSRTAPWLEFPVKWRMSRDERPLNPQDAHWWLPDANVSHVMIQVTPRNNATACLHRGNKKNAYTRECTGAKGPKPSATCCCRRPHAHTSACSADPDGHCASAVTGFIHGRSVTWPTSGVDLKPRICCTACC